MNEINRFGMGQIHDYTENYGDRLEDMNGIDDDYDYGEEDEEIDTRGGYYGRRMSEGFGMLGMME